MPSLANLFAFALVSLGMVLTPVPNMIYLISRSIIKVRVAGLHFTQRRRAWICLLHAARGIQSPRARFRLPYAYDALP